MRVYSKIRFGTTPVINAAATIMLAVSFTAILVAVQVNGRATKRAIEGVS